jgi:hypothetical protein
MIDKITDETIITQDDIGCLGFVCIRPELALQGDILRDTDYIIKLRSCAGTHVLDISKVR